MRKSLIRFIMAGFFCMLCFAGQASQPEPWQLGFQVPATSVMHEIKWFGDYTLWFIVPITLFVFFLLIFCVVRFHERFNPIPSRRSYNAVIEVVWTVVPVMILMFIAVPSFQLLTAQYTLPPEIAVTVKATANQWNWDYEYQLEEGFSFNSSLLLDEDRAGMNKENRKIYPRLLAVDNEMVVPVNVATRVLITSSDVIHAFAVPAFGVKVDAVPGRINEAWFKPLKEGLYYGQCSELCGKDHAFMPIAVRVVSEEQYRKWIAEAKNHLSLANRNLMDEIERTRKTSVSERN